MISDITIQEIYDKVDLVTVITKYVPDLKKKGANHTGCCPFHDEKTASFAVNDVKGMYKCFGCGVGGNNPVNFIMEKLSFDYPSAIKYLANWFGIDVIEDKKDEEPEEQKANRADYLKLNAWAAKKYQKALMEVLEKRALTGEAHYAADHIDGRNFTTDSLIAFQIGYAPKDFKFLTSAILERGMIKPANDIGLVKTTTDNNFDCLIDRIIYPIHDERGEVIGFGGRTLGDTKEYAKFLNSRDSLIYKKEKVLYGLYQAAASIRKLECAYLVEGYADVVSFAQTGAPNTVATCGTALTEGHCKLLLKYTKHIILIGDGDKAGKKSNLKNVDMLLRYGFKIEICPLPEEHDPDSFARTLDYKEMEEVAA